ncbi:unnamed protein product [Victoria cruziana]
MEIAMWVKSETTTSFTAVVHSSTSQQGCAERNRRLSQKSGFSTPSQRMLEVLVAIAKQNILLIPAEDQAPHNGRL